MRNNCGFALVDYLSPSFNLDHSGRIGDKKIIFINTLYNNSKIEAYKTKIDEKSKE